MPILHGSDAMYKDLVNEQHMDPGRAAAIVNAAKKRLAGKHKKKHKRPVKKHGNSSH
jgi:hypothetical protein